MESLEPIEIDPHDRELLEKIGRLRVQAWATVIPDIVDKTECWLDEHELSSRHWAIFHEGEPIAASRMSVHRKSHDVVDAEVYEGLFPEDLPMPIACFSRLVIHPAHRGQGLSGRLDATRMAAALEENVCTILSKTPAGPKRLAQFSSLGFRPVGSPRPEPVGSPIERLFSQPLVYECKVGSCVQPTLNQMGWSSGAINQVSVEFIRYAARCRHPVLDIGSAFGVATIPALMAGATVYANDLSSEHLSELSRRTPPNLRDRLQLVPGRFPDSLYFPEESFDAVHASQILHFLNADEVTTGLDLAFRWLRPGGRLFLLAATPYQATNVGFAPVFEERKKSGDPWPGMIDNVKTYNKHWSADLVPEWLHVFDDEILSNGVRRAGFRVEWARMFTRTGLPDFCRFDGRENLGLVAYKPD